MKASRQVALLRAKAVPVLADAGFTPGEIGILLSLTQSRVSVLGSGHFPRQRGDEARVDDMAQRYAAGETLEEISRLYSLSRERVRQLLSRRGINFENTRKAAVERRQARIEEHKRAQRKAKWNTHTARFYGCTLDEALAINGGRHLTDHQSPAKLFTRQRTTAASRGIEWAMTLPEWWSVWQESGHWEQRGRGKGRYCMSRKSDAGAYAIGNVEIKTNEENASESYETKPAAKRFKLVRDELGLSPRQRQIYDLYVAGINPRAIGAQLGISPGTARTSLCSIKNKLGMYGQQYGDA